MSVLWVDQNGDDVAQLEELQVAGDPAHQMRGSVWGYHAEDTLDWKLMVALADGQTGVGELKMKGWLPCIQLIDVHENPRRLVYRLVGESEVRVRGYNPTGRSVAETAIGQGTSDPLGNYAIVINEKKPVYDFSKINHSHGPQGSGYLVSQECVLLPLSDDGEHVNMVVTYGKVISSLAEKLKR